MQNHGIDWRRPVAVTTAATVGGASSTPVMAGGSQQPRPWGSSTNHGKEGGPRPAMGKKVEVDRPWGRRGSSTGHGGSRQPVDDGEEGGTDGGGRPAMGKKGRPWGSSAAGEEGMPRARAAARLAGAGEDEGKELCGEGAGA